MPNSAGTKITNWMQGFKGIQKYFNQSRSKLNVFVRYYPDF